MAATDREYQILIVGAGISGLATARFLAAAGVEPVVVESDECLATGVGPVEVWPDAMAPLSWLDLADAVQSSGTAVGRWTHRNAAGTVERRLVSDESPAFVVTEYGELCRAIQNSLPENTVITETAVSGLSDRDGGVTVDFDNGVAEQFDCVVGADGARSTVREAIESPVATMREAVTVAFPLEGSLEVTGASEQWRSDGAVLRVVPVDERHWGRLTLPSTTAEQLSAVRDVVTTHVEETGWLPLAALPDTAREFVVTDEVVVKSDTVTGNRVALVGDAARSRHSLSGLGLTCALEDAALLTRAITNNTDSLPQRISAYASRRRSRPSKSVGTAGTGDPLESARSDCSPALTETLGVRSGRLAATFAGTSPRPGVENPLASL